MYKNISLFYIVLAVAIASCSVTLIEGTAVVVMLTVPRMGSKREKCRRLFLRHMVDDVKVNWDNLF